MNPLHLYAVTLVVSATLLFTVQPMVARMVLPLLGGSAAVWTACMLFFQLALLAGYGYAHGLAGRLKTPTWAKLHVGLLVLAGLTLPLSVGDATPDPGAPLSWLLSTLVLRVAPTFVVVAASAPMLQHWFAGSKHPDAANPYQLYAASNVGSIVALMGYPFLIEPFIGLDLQRWLFAGGFVTLVALIALCGRALESAPQIRAETYNTQPSWAQRARWVGLAAIPSSLMLGVTQYLTTDLASVPLLWVVPLAIYLATFIAVFAARPRYFPVKAQPWIVLAVPLALAIASSSLDFLFAVTAHLSVFGLLTWSIHSQLAAAKPSPRHLTEYFLLLSVGGALGGALNAVLAPTFLKYAIDYQLMLMVAVLSLTWPRHDDALRLDPWRYAIPPLMFVIGFWMSYEVGFLAPKRASSVATVGFALAALGGLVFWRSSMARVAAVCLVALAAFEAADTRGLVAADRSFFGAYKVFDRDTPTGVVRKFSHGTTGHGAQFLGDKSRLPTAYHHPAGPVGQILSAVTHERVAVVGLGAGAMAAYGSPQHRFDFVEIDPLVVDIAREHFSYLADCGDACQVSVGDGRRAIAESSTMYDIIFLDAYNSDAVPIHLLTRQAHQVYRQKTNPHGIVVYHVSNRYLDIQAAVGAIAQDAGEVCWVQLHKPDKELERNELVMASMYAVVARTQADVAPLVATGKWRPCKTGGPLWTDDFGSILTIVK